MGTLHLLSGRQPLPSRLALTFSALFLAGCEVTPPTSQPTTSPLDGNQVYLTPGGVCSLNGITIDKGGDVEGPQNLVDGQCMQPWTNLTYQQPIANGNSAQCKVSYQTGFSYHYTYSQPQTNVSYYTSSQSYDLPQTAITYYSSSQSYQIPQTTVSYYTSSQSYDAPQTKISYYTSRQEYDSPYSSVSYFVVTQAYDTPTTNVTYFTQQSQASINLAGDFTAQGCAAFVAGKLPAGTLTDPYHLPSCAAGPLQHHVGACPASSLNCATTYAAATLPSPLAGNYQVNGCEVFAAGHLPANAALNDAAHPVSCAAATSVHHVGACSTSDTAVVNCTTVYALSTLPATSGNYLLSGSCEAYASGKLPASAITGDALHPVTCSAAPAVHKTGACDPSDPSITNCVTNYALSTINNQQGDFTAAGCAAFAAALVPPGAITNDPSHPITCSAGAAKNMTGTCDPANPAILNCTTNYASHVATVNGTPGALACDAFAAGKLPANALLSDASHAPSCAATSRHVVGSCSPADSSIQNCVTTYAQATLNNQAGDYSAQGCDAFAAGKLPSGAITGDAAHPVTCAAATTAVKTADGTISFADNATFSPALGDACGADLAAFIASSKSLPAATSCTISAVQSGTYVYNNTTCANANPASYCAASNGARRNCVGVDVGAGQAFETAFTTSKVKGTVTCATQCSDTTFCKTASGTVGDNYHNCSTTLAADTVDHAFTAASASDAHVCSSGQKQVNSGGPYGVHTPPTLTSNLPNNACIQTTVCLNDSAWKKLTPVKQIPSIDLVILFDVTSSMTPEIQAMVRNLENLITNLNGLTPNLRLGLASYRDFADAGGQAGDLPFMLNVPLTSDMTAVANGLSALTAGGGGDLPESLSTAIRATVTGNAFAPYFGASTMGWQNDPSRIKVILAVSDAADKKTGLPAGAATIDEVAALMKSQGILFMGIGYKDQVEPYPGENAFRSFADFSYLAQNTGAIVQGAGVDLDGDGQTTTYGELPPGAPAVLLMTENGQLEGAPQNADPTRVLADAITQMVVTTRPFQFNLNVASGGRTYTPPTNSLSIPSEASGQYCFTQVAMQPLDATAACGVSTPISVSVSEASTNTNVSNSDFVASVNVNGNCYVPPTPTDPTPPATGAWALSGFDGTTTGTSASLIWQVTGSGTLTTATVNMGTRPDQLNLQSVTKNATLGSQVLTLAGLTPSTTYYFQVTVRDNAGTVVSSGVISKTTKAQ